MVHNGIIENYADLKKQLMAEGHKFQTETDTEIIAHLIEKFSKDSSLEGAVQKTVKVMTGAYALVAVSTKDRTGRGLGPASAGPGQAPLAANGCGGRI